MSSGKAAFLSDDSIWSVAGLLINVAMAINPWVSNSLSGISNRFYSNIKDLLNIASMAVWPPIGAIRCHVVSMIN